MTQTTKSKVPDQNPSKFPQFNAKIGDEVIYQGERHWLVLDVGFINKHGYYLNIKISPPASSKLKRRIVSTFDLPIIAPLEEIARLRDMMEFLDKYPHILPARYGRNANFNAYRLYCTQCNQFLKNIQHQTEIGSVRFCIGATPDNGSFESYDMSTEDGYGGVFCKCVETQGLTMSEKIYEVPNLYSES